MLLPAFFMLQVAASQGPLPEVVTRAHIDQSRGVDFHARVTPDTVFVGQQATYQLGVFLDQDTRQRLRRNPEFLPPESRSMLSYDLSERNGSLSVTIGGRAYEVHVFRRALFPLTPGRYQIPSARLTYTLPQNPSFFSREESFTLRSETATLVAIDPPAAGRPADWAGAVGVWHAEARIDSARGRTGDPLVLTLRIEGQGNVTLLPRPALAISWASVVTADERVRLDSTPSAFRGTKEFDWLVTPAASGAQTVPAIRFTYFNPFTRRYEVARTDPLTVRVAPGAVVALDAAAPADAAPFPLRPAIGDEAPLPLGDLATIRWLLAFAPLAAVVAWIARRPRRSPRAATPWERLHAMAEPRASEVSSADVRRAFLDGLCLRTGLEPAVLAQPGAWVRALRREGVRDETAREAEALLDLLDATAFGGMTSVGGAGLASRADDVLGRVANEAAPRGSVRRAVIHSVLRASLFAIAGSGILFARTLQRAREPFAQGVVSYAGADYPRAVRLFEDAAREAPRASAAWANLGTASWAARDTAGAVVGWQRALRLDPTAGDLRDRLALTRAPQDVGLARVSAVPARGPSLLALLFWIAGWSLVSRQCWRRRAALRLAVLTLLVAGGLCAWSRAFENRLEGRGLVVVTDPAALRALPALGAEGGSVPLVGEVARVVRRQGVWTHVTLDGGRDGWISTERLASLGRD